MQLCVLLLIALGVVTVTRAAKNVGKAKGLDYLGVGYNILNGNPDGSELPGGGVDPGLLSDRKIFKLTWNTEKMTVDGKLRIPDQVNFAHHASCADAVTQNMFTGTKTYQENLKAVMEKASEFK